MHATLLACAALLALMLQLAAPAAVPADRPAAQPLRILLFTKTAGFRHDSIPAGIEAMNRLAREHNLDIHPSEDASIFTDATLRKFDVIVFLNTTGTLFDESQRLAFQRFIRSGRGFVGIHSAADTEHDWPWYRDLVGAHFKSHPAVQPAEIIIENIDHVSTRHLRDIATDTDPPRWRRTDEWYDFKRNPRGLHAKFHVLLSLDTSTYTGSTMGEDHPIAWHQEFDGGRAWYTGLGHTRESYEEPAFLQHVLGGLKWAADVAEAR